MREDLREVGHTRKPSRRPQRGTRPLLRAIADSRGLRTSYAGQQGTRARAHNLVLGAAYRREVATPSLAPERAAETLAITLKTFWAQGPQPPYKLSNT